MRTLSLFVFVIAVTIAARVDADERAGRHGGGGGAAHGRTEWRSRIRQALGGGVTIQNLRTGLGANVGFQKIFINGGETMFGISLTVAPR